SPARCVEPVRDLTQRTSEQEPGEGGVGHLSDRGLLALVGRGDREAFARLYDMYGGAAYSLAVRIVRDRELAADVVQNTFLAIWTPARTFDSSRGQPSTWIL